MHKFILPVFLLGLIFLSACNTVGDAIQDIGSSCNQPYFEYKSGDCCLDTNDNNICDSDEDLDFASLEAELKAENSNDVTGQATDESPKTEEVAEEFTEVVENVTEETAEVDLSALSPHELCLYKFNMDGNDLIFRYTTWDSFSNEWNPIVEALKQLDYTVVSTKAGSDISGSFEHNDNFMKECFPTLKHERVTPLFICAGNKDEFIGIEADVYVLRDFADDCKE